MKQKRRAGMDNAAKKQLVERCLPALRAKGVSSLEDVSSIRCRDVQGVWTGEGGIAEMTAIGTDGATAPIIVKSIGSYKNCDPMSLQDHWSYYNEVSFYETDIPDRMCAAGALCPRPLYVQRTSSGAKGGDTSSRTQKLLQQFKVISPEGGEEKDTATICMTQLTGGRWPSSKSNEALLWLARLHALFWGQERTDAAVAAGVSDQACFWHLDNRAIELQRMGNGILRVTAAGIDARLKADRMQTLCHGDPKGANIMWDDETGIAMYDFQWLGKAPPTKDIVYFFATAAMNGGRYDERREEAYLLYYHTELCALLEAQGIEKPTFKQLHDSYMLACVDYRRWQEGGFAWGNQSLLDANAAKVFDKLHSGGSKPTSEKEYHVRIFDCFPP